MMGHHNNQWSMGRVTKLSMIPVPTRAAPVANCMRPAWMVCGSAGPAGLNPPGSILLDPQKRRFIPRGLRQVPYLPVSLLENSRIGESRPAAGQDAPT